MRRLVAPVAAAVAVLAGPSAAHAVTVSVQFSAFAPSQLDVLPGETVEWQNVSLRRHTVNADDGAFASGDLVPDAAYARRFDAVGAYPYHCTVHAGMTGEVDVRRVTLDALPPIAVAGGTTVAFSGRSADPGAPVELQRGGVGGFATVATLRAAPDGSWATRVPAVSTGDYRAASGADASEIRRLLVQDRKVRIRRTGTGVAVTVRPPLPYGRVALQEYLRERFGWWPVRRVRLDYLSVARFRVAERVPVRVVLLDRDGWTPLATSDVLPPTAARRARSPSVTPGPAAAGRPARGRPRAGAARRRAARRT